MDAVQQSTGCPVLDKINVELEAASTREDKRAVLLKYMSEDQAESSIGLVMGESNGDVLGREFDDED